MSEYFTAHTTQCIADFQSAATDEEKHRIFNTGIRPAFEKLIESQIHVYRFHKIDDPDTLKRECLTNLYEMIPKFDPSRGTKGFSYFNVVVRNWFIHKYREKKKRGKTESELFYDLDRENVKNDPSFSLSPFEDSITEKEFWRALFENMEFWRTKLTKPSEKKVLDATIFLIRNAEMADTHSRKAAYLYLRELTGLNTKQVVMGIKKLRTLYTKFKDKFDSEGNCSNED